MNEHTDLLNKVEILSLTCIWVICRVTVLNELQNPSIICNCISTPGSYGGAGWHWARAERQGTSYQIQKQVQNILNCQRLIEVKKHAIIYDRLYLQI